MSNWYDGVVDTLKKEGTQLAEDWIRNTANVNRPQVQVSPQPTATLPAAQVQSQYSNKLLMYGALVVAIIGLIYLFKSSGGKRGK